MKLLIIRESWMFISIRGCMSEVFFLKKIFVFKHYKIFISNRKSLEENVEWYCISLGNIIDNNFVIIIITLIIS